MPKWRRDILRHFFSGVIVLIKEILVPGLRTIPPEATILEASKIMEETGFRHLPVSDGKKVIGVLSDRDIQRAITVVSTPNEKTSFHIQKHKKVSEYMSSPVFKMRCDERLDKLIREVLDRKISSVLIEDEDYNDMGIITTQDLMLVLLDELHSRISFFQKVKNIFYK